MQYRKQWICGRVMKGKVYARGCGLMISSRLITGIVLLAVGCFFPGVSQEEADRFTDQAPPEILLVSPGPQDRYGASVLIEGQAADYTDQAKSRSGRIDSLVCEILGEAAIYPVEINNGVFRKVISTDEYSATLNLKLTATDWNGLAGSVTVQLLPGPFAAFKASPGSKEVTLSWEPVPAADSYTVYYTDDGSLPAEDNGKKAENVQSPLTLPGLQNGLLYSFVLKAAGSTPGVQDNWSHVVKTIPLSPFSLFPRVDSYVNHLELRWERIQGTEKYLVYRSTTGPDGVYTAIGGDLAVNYYTDNDVLPGQTCYYRIAPALKGCRQSETAAASLYPLKPFCYEEGAITGLSHTTCLAVKDEVCYVSGEYNNTGGIHCFSLLNPAAPRFAGTLPLAAVNKLAVVGDFLAAAAADAVYLVDVADADNPGTPVLLRQSGGARCLDLAAEDSCLYLLQEATGIIRIDLSAPGTPQTTLLAATTETIENIVIDNGKLYYMAYTDDMGMISSSHLEIYDISSMLSASYDMTDTWDWFAGAVEAVRDGTLIIGLYGWSGGKELFDVTEAGLPDFFASGYPVSRLELPDTGAVEFHRDCLFTGSTDPLIILNRQSNTRIQYERFPRRINNMVFYGDYLYAGSADSGSIRIFNIRTPFDAEATAAVSAGVNGYAMQIAGNSLYLVFRNSINIYDLSLPGAPVFAGCIPVPGLQGNCPSHIKIAGNYLFLANSHHFYIYKITGSGSLVRQYDLSGGAILDMQIYGDFVHLSCGYSGFVILDISQVENPVLFFTYTDQLPVNRSFLVEGFLYLVTHNQIRIQDTSYLPTTMIIAKPPLFMDNIELGFVRYPQLFLFDRDIDNTGYFISHIYSLALPQYPRVTGQDSLNFATHLPDSFSLAGTYAIGITYRDLDNDGIPEICNSLFDLNDFDNISYIGPMDYAFTACAVAGSSLYTYNCVTGILSCLKLTGN